ncbi:LysR substrate-binding domain-containing protein [Caulobacter sp. 17J65-9]|uniref:LysR substrate-binding domain-containing protein n=1 Tax=Caulobacter sp. 17J65-9 TaxID=2709382 RepID=UPI0013C6C254|nr:LysR substrate-binding domain-containing protein [Caulobacter sp. 17J65-9]NEX95237.1 LysR family transcriptional regulator [Caulobacter sp. 17J65-9]
MSDVLATLPLSAVRVFEAAARLGSFTRAAEELGMTQAAVSWQIKSLESRLGQSLFRRLPREVVLTPAGERLSRAATDAMSLLRTALSDLTETGKGVLAVTTLFTFANQWLSPRLGGFQLAHPDLALRLDTNPSLLDLAGGGLDLGVRAGDGRWPGLESTWLMPSIQTPLLAPALLERLGGLDSPSDLATAPRIGTDSEWAQWFGALGLGSGERRTRFTADTQIAEVASALSGQGVALANPILFARELADGRLVQPFETVVETSPGYWVAYPTERRRTPKIALFRDWLLAEAAADPAVQAYAAARPK